MARRSDSVTKAAPWSHTGVTLLVWDRNESLMGDTEDQQHTEEETLTSVDSLRGQRRRQQRSRRVGGGPAMGGKLKKKLASLEEPGTKTKSMTGCTKGKQAQFRKK